MATAGVIKSPTLAGLRIGIVFLVAKLMRVPVDVHQRFFMGAYK